jgi:hypothetical protein
VTHLELDWEYVTLVLEKEKGTLVAHTSMLHAKWQTMFYLLFPIYTKRCMDFGQLPTHVPSAMPNHFDGDKEDMFTM